MPALSLAQTLHGYDGGHRLLAKGGDIDERELFLLDRLSDLSGYLPAGTTFDAYWSGFPCGRHYAFACTWLDTAAARGGTVLTHSLLVPLSALGELPDLWALAASFRRPASPHDRAVYERSLVVPIQGEPPPSPPGDRARAIVALLFGQSERPVLWLDDGPAEDVARYAWSLLWPGARRSFAFCTFALQARSIEKQPFDFLALPDAARGAFHERAGSTGWWDRGKLRPAVAVFSEDPWTSTVVARGPAALAPVLALCRDQALPIPRPWAFREAQRLLDLAPAAGRDLTAARARADLVFWTWPTLDPSHPLATEVLDTLLARQSAAPFDAQPLRELRDIVSRQPALARARADQAFSRRMGDVLRREVELRFSKGILSELEALLKATAWPDWQAAIVKGMLAAIPRDRREPMLQAIAAGLAPEVSARLFALAGLIAVEAEDVDLAFSVKNLQGDAAGGLRDAALIASRSGGLDKVRELAEVSARAPRPVAVEQLREEPGLALPFTRLAIREGVPAALFLDTALSVLSLEDALSDALRQDFTAPGTPSWARQVADHIAPIWAQAVGRGDLAAGAAARWIAVEPLRAALGRAPSELLFRGSSDLGAWLGPLSRALALAAEAKIPGGSTLAERLLRRPLDEARARDLEDAAPALGALLGVPPATAERYAVAAAALEAVRRTRPLGASGLVERAFPIVYRTLVAHSGGAFSLFSPASWFTSSWDRAKPWRRWLVETWLSNRWPPDAFLRCLAGDHALFRRLVRRLARSAEGLAFLSTLPAALAKDPSLRHVWAGEVERALENPEDPVDYE